MLPAARRAFYHPMAAPFIQIRGLTQRFGENEVLLGIDMDVFRGETLIILGSSGGGKSVLLKHLPGLLKATGGTIHVIVNKVRASAIGLNPNAQIRQMLSRFGGMTASLALLVRDRREFTVAHQMLIYPMLDDRNETPSSREIVDVGIWDRAGNIEAWDWYLGGQPADAYAAPARATDLTGLPPTLAEADAFLADETPAAYEKVVDRLMKSVRYAERMTLDWLDAARYGDTYGRHEDADCATWPYRDWVIQAFNADMPLAQFTTEQLADRKSVV